MDTARIFACNEQALERGAAIGCELDAAHYVVRSRHHFNQAAGEIEAAVSAALEHAAELFPDEVPVQVAHGDEEPAAGARVAGTHLLIHGARDEVPRCALG